MSTGTLRRSETWTARRRAALVLRILRGQTTVEAAAAEHGLRVDDVLAWRRRFLRGARRALGGAARRERRPRAAQPGERARRRVFEDVSQAVGDTPLVRLRRAVAGPAEVYAKLEFMNPLGSVKDRVARHMIDEAARTGRIAPGDVIVEASSGNTAMGLGMMAILRGYRCKVVVRDRTSREKVDALRALGVEVMVVDGSLPPGHPDSYNRIMERVVRETPRAYFPDQHNNRENNEAHYLTTGPEVWEQMDGRIDVFVAGVGTGGTIGGVARYLKERDPRVRVVAVDPEGSVLGEYFRTRRLGAPRPYLLEGLGDEALIGCVDFDLIDEFLTVPDGEAFRCARELARQEAIFAGASSGAALWAVRQVVQGLGGRPARVVTLFPDGGGRYLSKVYSDEWMQRNGFAEPPPG